MLKTDSIYTLATHLFEAEKQGYSVAQLSEKYPEMDEVTAYKIQDRLIEKKIEEEITKISGYKLGLTSKAKQIMIGVDEPTYGVLLENMELEQDKPISITPLIHAKVEPEIAFVFKKEVKGPHVTVAQILDATKYVVPSLEIIDSRYNGFKMTHSDGIADNSSSSRYIVGDRFYDPAKFDLRLTGMVFKKNGEVAATAAGAAVMGHPARAVAWLANKLYRVDKSIKPGEIVLSGSLTTSITIEPGDHFSASFDGMGTVEAAFVE
ncbi:4-oxalocrotonate decarboxylase [Oceanobacillus arenosus]|uniref:4-oxalocrotonate decarboxylase n=1 Tax=Oceanobacillus arenosus TaxID=1229153 RepID=A0A3D8PY86_9BACI|nr:fumarylacetoacetate hydrolase family protein [Oceanobacillus arenosus]RDW20119.1 4-oxalocrotonate decarboxylase [Oceanobacillus arenosus]